MKLIEILEEIKDEIISSRYQNFCDRMLELYPAPDLYTEEEKKNHYSWHIPAFISLLGKEPKDSEGMNIRITFVEEDNSEYDWDDEEWFDVCGYKPDDKNTYALEFTDWDQWLSMDVSDDTGKNLSNFDMFIHCLWEMSFLGCEGSSEKVIEELNEMMKSIKDGTAETMTHEDFVKQIEENLEDDK